MKSYIQDNRLEFAKLPEIEPHVRDVFLTWLSKALENKSLQGKTEDGQVYRVEKSDTEEICILKSSDGNLQMPAYVIVFEKMSEGNLKRSHESIGNSAGTALDFEESGKRIILSDKG